MKNMITNSAISQKAFEKRAIGRRIKIAIFVLFLLGIKIGHAQKMEGSVRYLVTENHVKKLEAVDYLSKQMIDRMSYMWGNILEWKYYTRLYLTPTQSKFVDSDEKAEKEDEGYSWRRSEYMINRDYQKNRMDDIMDVMGKTYRIEDTLKAPKWKILNDMKEIAGHICMNAFWNDTVRMQKVVAWYAMDIPNGGGPDRYFGLPGLILEVNINNGAKITTADLIEVKKLTTEMDLPKKIRAKKIKEQEYFGILRKQFAERRKAEENPYAMLRY